MEIDLRRFLSKHGIHWRDKGKNCSRNHVNVACPFCRDDPSEHLGISELGLGYFCLRNPRHCGINLYTLFVALGIPKKALEGLEFKQGERVEETTERDYSAWLYFKPAFESQEALDYLYSRKFSDPQRICKLFNLQVADNGKWAGRLIFPLTTGWSGRSMRVHIEPRYKSETDESGRWEYGRSSSCIVIEGAIDGMRLASVSNEFAYEAMCGMRLSPALIMQLRNKSFSTIYYIEDNGVDPLQTMQSLQLLRSYCVHSQVVSAHFPEHVKDAAMLHEEDARQWLMTLTPQKETRMAY